MNKNWKIIIVGFLTLGMVVTFFDYRQWKHTETEKFGQGWSDLKPAALNLTRSYQNFNLGVKMKLPEKNEIDNMINLQTYFSDENLTDLVRKEADKIKLSGSDLLRDWEYINTDKINLTILTWNEDIAGGTSKTKQLIMAKNGNKVLRMDVTVDTSDFGKWENTLLAVYKSVEFIRP